ncbi:hypothetical protein V8E53_008736 [Lactarius tabidus]
MSTIESGKCYKIMNEEYGLVFDLSSGDNTSVLGWEFHGGDNQQRILEKQDDGQWTIQSVRYNRYLGIENTSPQDGTRVVGLQKPRFLWDIELLPDSEDHDNTRVRLWVRGTLLVVEFPKESSESGSRAIQLWPARDLNGRYHDQVWVLEERESRFSTDDLRD